MTLSDFMGWSAPSEIKRNNSAGDLEEYSKEKDDKGMSKSPDLTPKKKGYLDKLEYLNAMKSPISRH
ncbi:hypothetical protein L6164_005254 [Bauhinia variegata]|nr:hypothetical protein L6164_005254 [Bauhinia variegata]